MTITAALSRPSVANGKKSKGKASRSNFVQQTFQWDAPNSAAGSSTSTNKSVGASECFLTVPKKSRQRVDVKGKSERVGHCEHAGGLMEKVLSRYGISPEEFRLAVEELRASRANNSQ